MYKTMYEVSAQAMHELDTVLDVYLENGYLWSGWLDANLLHVALAGHDVENDSATLAARAYTGRAMLAVSEPSLRVRVRMSRAQSNK